MNLPPSDSSNSRREDGAALPGRSTPQRSIVVESDHSDVEELLFDGLDPEGVGQLTDWLDEMTTAAAHGQFGVASEITLAALDRFGGDKAPLTTAWLCQHLAGVLRDAGETQIAAGYQKLAAKYAAQAAADRTRSVPGAVSEGLHEVGSPFASAALTGRALDALAQGDLDSCERWLGVAFGLEQRRGDRAGMAADWGNLGVVSLLREDWTECVYRLRRAWRLHLELDDHEGCGRDLLNMAEVLWRLKRPRLARRLFLRAADRFARAGAPWLHGRALERRAECRTPLGQVRLAASWN